MYKYEFSKEDYLMYKDFFATNFDRNKIVAIDSVHQKHDKTFKDILKSRKEMSKFLKDFIELNVESKDIEKYNSSFITSNFQRRESDMIYKLKGKDIYYLIEHQSKVDKNMPQRILEYCVELMREIQKGEKNTTGINPVIVPIVIYTGENKWKVPLNFSDTQKVDGKYKEYEISLKYKLIDINQYSKEELLEKNTKISTMMLIEKHHTSEEIRNILIELLLLTKDKETKNWLKDIIKYIFQDVLKDKIKELLKLIEEKEECNMEEWLERVKRNDEKIKKDLIKQGKKVGREEGIKEGIKETVLTMIKKMLKRNESDDKIMEYTNIDKKELDKIKKELELQI